jgi:CheY-like chemotaxis protein
MHQKPLVLLVYPDSDCRQMYVDHLRRHHVPTVAAADGSDALQLAATADILVTELCVPRVDGIQLIAAVRSNPATSHVPVVVLTASARESDRDRAERAGCDLFLPVPCSPDNLLRHLRRLWTLHGTGTTSPAVDENPRPTHTYRAPRPRLEAMQQTTERIRAEFMEMPGLRLSAAQLQRLCGIDASMCHGVLGSLIKTRFLRLNTDGTYARRTEGLPARTRVAAKVDAPTTPSLREAS